MSNNDDFEEVDIDNFQVDDDEDDENTELDKKDILEQYAEVVVECLRNAQLKNSKATLNKGNRGKRTSGMNAQATKKANAERDNIASKRIPFQFNRVGNDQLDVILKKAMFFRFRSSDTTDLNLNLERTKKAKCYAQDMMAKEISSMMRKIPESDKAIVRGYTTVMCSQSLNNLTDYINSKNDNTLSNHLTKIKEYYDESILFEKKASSISKEIEGKQTNKYNRIAKTCFNILAGSHKKYGSASGQQKFYDLIVQKFRGNNVVDDTDNSSQTQHGQHNQYSQHSQYTQHRLPPIAENRRLLPEEWKRGENVSNNTSNSTFNNTSNSTFNNTSNSTFNNTSNNLSNTAGSNFAQNKFGNSSRFCSSTSGSTDENTSKLDSDGWQTQKSKFSKFDKFDKPDNKFSDKTNKFGSRISGHAQNSRKQTYDRHKDFDTTRGTQEFQQTDKQTDKQIEKFPELVKSSGQPQKKDTPTPVLGAWGKKSAAIFAPPVAKQEKSESLTLENLDEDDNMSGMITLRARSVPSIHYNQRQRPPGGKLEPLPQTMHLQQGTQSHTKQQSNQFVSNNWDDDVDQVSSNYIMEDDDLNYCESDNYDYPSAEPDNTKIKPVIHSWGEDDGF